MRDNMVKKLASPSILHNKEKLFFRFNNLIQLDNDRVSKYLENMNLAADSFCIRSINNLVFFEDLDSNFLVCEQVSTYSDFTKCPLAQITP